MNEKKIALIDKYGDVFTEGDNFIGYATGFLDKKNIVFQLDPLTIDFQKKTADCYGLNLIEGKFSRNENKKKLDITSFDIIMDLSDVDDLDFSKKLSEIRTLHINNPLEMYASADKRTYIDRYPEFIPETIVSSNISELSKILEEKFNGEMIVKDPFGACGKGVEKISSNQPNYKDILIRMTNNETKEIVAQKFMEFASKGSKRVAVVGKVGIDNSYKIIHFYGREPEAGKWKDNIAQGGKVIDLDSLREDEKKLCLDVARKSGLYTVGLDIMDDLDENKNIISRLIETNSVLAFSANGKYSDKLNKVTDFILGELL